MRSAPPVAARDQPEEMCGLFSCCPVLLQEPWGSLSEQNTPPAALLLQEQWKSTPKSQSYGPAVSGAPGGDMCFLL